MIKVDYHAVPYAVFSYPEIASVGMGEKEALEKYGQANLLIGFHKYEDTAKGHAMDVKDYFVKIIFEKSTQRILGAHIIGPYASILIQEVVNLMYTKEENPEPIIQGMHIHPALSEVVQKAFIHWFLRNIITIIWDIWGWNKTGCGLPQARNFQCFYILKKYYTITTIMR